MSIRNDAKRWERLEALGIKRESVERDISTPDREFKMSAVLLKLAEPLIQRPGRTVQQAETIIALTVATWNKSLLPEGRQPALEKESTPSCPKTDLPRWSARSSRSWS